MIHCTLVLSETMLWCLCGAPRRRGLMPVPSWKWAKTLLWCSFLLVWLQTYLMVRAFAILLWLISSYQLTELPMSNKVASRSSAPQHQHGMSIPLCQRQPCYNIGASLIDWKCKIVLTTHCSMFQVCCINIDFVSPPAKQFWTCCWPAILDWRGAWQGSSNCCCCRTFSDRQSTRDRGMLPAA